MSKCYTNWKVQFTINHKCTLLIHTSYIQQLISILYRNYEMNKISTDNHYKRMYIKNNLIIYQARFLLSNY
jgi:hypothetical protein